MSLALRGSMTPLLLLSLAFAQSPDELADRALAANPSLEALRLRTQELQQLASVADTWPDPVLGLEVSNLPVDSFALGGHPMSGLQLKATQGIPTPGLTQAREDLALERVELSEHALAEARLQLEVQVHTLWWRLALVRELEQVTQEHLERTEDLLAAVRARYEVGEAGQSALLRLSLLSDRLEDELGDYRRSEAELLAALSRALSEPTSVDTAPQLSVLEAPEGVDTSARPALAAAEQQVQVHLAAAELARADGRPDLSVWAGYRVRIGDNAMDQVDLASVGLGMPIPLGSRKRAQAQEAAAHSAASGAEATLFALQDQIDRGLDASLARWERAEDKALTYGQELLPQAESVLTTTLSDYQVGRADFASLYDAEVVLLQLERARLMAAAETHLQRAQVAGLSGTWTEETP
jgi:cobalt-zinc-cadmium efflux system outer membrane protein